MAEKQFTENPKAHYRHGKEWSLIQQRANGSIRPQVVALKHADPTRTLQSIGDELGVSRERIRQILKAEGLNDKYPVKEYRAKRANLFNSCSECGVDIITSDYTGRRRALCTSCRKLADYNALYTTVECPRCGTTWDMRTKELKTRLILKLEYNKISSGALAKNVPPAYQPFCSRKCTALYYGFQGRPSKLTPEIAILCDQLLKAGESLGAICREIQKTFGVRVGKTTISSWKQRGMLTPQINVLPNPYDVSSGEQHTVDIL